MGPASLRLRRFDPRVAGAAVVALGLIGTHPPISGTNSGQHSSAVVHASDFAENAKQCASDIPDGFPGIPKGADKFSGKMSWFMDAGTASGANAKRDPGVAVRRPGTSYGAGVNEHSLGGYFFITFPNHISVILKQIDIGPNQTTGRVLDVSLGALHIIKYGPGKFPTDSTAHLVYLGQSAKWKKWANQPLPRSVTRGGCTPCPTSSAVTNVRDSSIDGGHSTPIPRLAGQVKPGTRVQVSFTVHAACKVELHLAAYSASHGALSLTDKDGQTFTAGTHQISVAVPSSDFEVDFVGGTGVITDRSHDHYGRHLIDSATGATTPGPTPASTPDPTPSQSPSASPTPRQTPTPSPTPTARSSPTPPPAASETPTSDASPSSIPIATPAPDSNGIDGGVLGVSSMELTPSTPSTGAGGDLPWEPSFGLVALGLGIIATGQRRRRRRSSPACVAMDMEQIRSSTPRGRRR